MNGVSSVKIFSWGLESPPQVLNLNQGIYLVNTSTKPKETTENDEQLPDTKT